MSFRSALPVDPEGVSQVVGANSRSQALEAPLTPSASQSADARAGTRQKGCPAGSAYTRDLGVG
jgi:hypothetical protein